MFTTTHAPFALKENHLFAVKPLQGNFRHFILLSSFEVEMFASNKQANSKENICYQQKTIRWKSVQSEKKKSYLRMEKIFSFDLHKLKRNQLEGKHNFSFVKRIKDKKIIFFIRNNSISFHFDAFNGSNKFLRFPFNDDK